MKGDARFVSCADESRDSLFFLFKSSLNKKATILHYEIL